MALIESDELIKKIVENCDELRGYAFQQVMKQIEELKNESKCKGCMGAAFGDCEKCGDKGNE